MKKTERTVYFYDLEVTSKSRKYGEEYPISIDTAIKLIEAVPSKNRTKPTSNGRETLYISDIKRKGNTIALLVNKSDKRIADPVFSNPKEHRRRVIEKEMEEGQDYSSHILLITNQNDPSQSLALVEHCQGLGISAISLALDSIIKLAKNEQPEEFKRPDPNGACDPQGNPVTHEVTHVFEFKGHPSQDLQEDLNNGVIRSIELISERNKYSNIDENSYFQEKHRVISITPVNKNTIRNRIYSEIKRLLKSRREDHEKARVRFKTQQDMVRTVEIDAFNTFSQHYIRKEKIQDFRPELKGSYSEIHLPIIEKMKELVNELIDDQKLD